MTNISGLSYLPDFISPAEEHSLIEIIDTQPWLTDLKRRVQHYGYRYDYRRRTVERESMYLGHLPSWLNSIVKRLCAANELKQTPDQCIINEYLPGQGISPHVDCVPCFTENIFSLSLASHCVMDFSHLRSGTHIPMLLFPRSLLSMQGEARYSWKHSIPSRKSDTVQAHTYTRSRRISLTFRKVII